jgi:hypothetical protein
MENSVAIETKNLGRIYKIRNNRKEKFKELLALETLQKPFQHLLRCQILI